jgi:NTE family protein
MGNSKSLSAKFVETVRGCDFLICSDASGPIGSQGVLQLALSGRLPSPRLFDICSDQIRALRSRMLIRAIIDKSIRAVLLKMGNSVRDIDIKTDQNRPAALYDRFQADQDVGSSFAYPTDLRALPPASFDGVARHEYELADATLMARAPEHFTHSIAWT